MNLQELKDSMYKNAFGMTVQEAIDKNICIQCKKLPEFYSEAGKREYQISGLCESCFDKIIKVVDI